MPVSRASASSVSAPAAFSRLAGVTAWFGPVPYAFETPYSQKVFRVAGTFFTLQSVVIVLVYDAVVSFIILKIIDMVIGLRVTTEVEREGLDLALHGEVVQ